MTDDRPSRLSERAAAAERETGTAFDLTTCVREPIHRLGGVQSYGALVGIRDGRIAVLSTNAEALLGARELLGAPAEWLLGAEQLHRLTTLAAADTGPTGTMPVELESGRFDVTVHRSEGVLVLEFEAAGREPSDFGTLYAPFRQALTRLQQAGTVADACRAAVREVRAITGYDRVVAYRFEWLDGPGEVIAEEVVPEWEPWLGLWFPATDIPPQARLLYERNWIRVIVDVGGTTAALVPPVLPETGEPLDLSLAALRTVSPFHLEYLRNIGVTASMSVSLLADGRLWGLIACHGRTARTLSPQVRAACEFFGVALSLHLAALRERDEAAAREHSRTAITRLVERITAGLPADWQHGPGGLVSVVACDAVAVRRDGTVTVQGAEAGAVGALLDKVPPLGAGELWHSDRLGTDGPFAGALVLPLTASGDCVAWLRAERTVARRWATDPRTPVVLGPNGHRLTPRGSTAVFLATVRGRSLPWSATDLAMAAELGRSMTAVALADARRLALLNAELSRSNLDLDSFAHAAAHDLKEPLRGIANIATFIAEDAADRIDDRTAERLESIQRLATRMDELLNTLLYYSRLGRTGLRRESIALTAALSRALDVAGPRLAQAGVQVEPPDASATVYADPVLLDEVLVNFLVNAAKYARPQGRRRVAVGVGEATPPDGSGPQPAVFVADNGIGLPAHLRE